MDRRIIQLRELLAERFPATTPGKPPDSFATGLAPLDATLGGGLEKGAITELTCAPPIAAGSALLVAHLLHTAAAANHWLALIDGSDSFDPQPLGNAPLARLLWVRCHEAGEALKAADLLLRDGNLPLVVLDLRMNPTVQLRKIPATTWYRFQRIVEKADTAFLIVTPRPMVAAARVKLTLRSRFNLGAIEAQQATTQAELDFQRTDFHPAEMPLLRSA